MLWFYSILNLENILQRCQRCTRCLTDEKNWKKMSEACMMFTNCTPYSCCFSTSGDKLFNVSSFNKCSPVMAQEPVFTSIPWHVSRAIQKLRKTKSQNIRYTFGKTLCTLSLSLTIDRFVSGEATCVRWAVCEQRVRFKHFSDNSHQSGILCISDIFPLNVSWSLRRNKIVQVTCRTILCRLH